MSQFNANANRSAILAKIRSEIDNDPAAVGYADKTDFEIVGLLHANQFVSYANVLPPRISTILTGVPYAPNIVDEADVTEARA
jgi:hypothetical protein